MLVRSKECERRNDMIYYELRCIGEKAMYFTYHENDSVTIKYPNGVRTALIQDVVKTMRKPFSIIHRGDEYRIISVGTTTYLE
jgi:hypothetical protein